MWNANASIVGLVLGLRPLRFWVFVDKYIRMVLRLGFRWFTFLSTFGLFSVCCGFFFGGLLDFGWVFDVSLYFVGLFEVYLQVKCLLGDLL